MSVNVFLDPSEVVLADDENISTTMIMLPINTWSITRAKALFDPKNSRMVFKMPIQDFRNKKNVQEGLFHADLTPSMIKLFGDRRRILLGSLTDIYSEIKPGTVDITKISKKIHMKLEK